MIIFFLKRIWMVNILYTGIYQILNPKIVDMTFLAMKMSVIVCPKDIHAVHLDDF